MERQTPTASQIELLMSDWLANLREQGSYVHKNYKGAIKVKKTNNYSDYFTSGMNMNDMLDVMRNAREIAQGTVASMTEVPVKVMLGSNASCTDGKTIVIATDYFDDPKLTIGDKIDILTGFAVHEAAHVNHTDMEDGTTFISTFPPAEREVAHAVHNILEDERIEYLTGEDRPGLMDFIAAVKDHCWREYEKDKSLNAQITEPLPKFLNTLLSAVRFPSMLTEEAIIENFDELCEIRKVLMPYPLTNEATKAAVKKILTIMKNMIKKDLEEKQKQQEQQDQSQQGGQPNSQNQQGQSQGQNSGQDGQQQQGGQQSQGSGSPKNKQKGPSAQEVKQALSQALSSKEMNQILSAINKAVPNPNQNNPKQAGSLGNTTASEYVNGEADKVGAGSGNITYAVKKKPNQTVYMRSYNKVKHHIPSIRKALTCQTQTRDYELRGEKNGKLNTNKLASLVCGNRNIFTRQGEVTCDKISLCLLIDESGSMHGARTEAARETAILIKEAVKTVDNLDLFIYGFEGSRITVYQEGRKNNRYTLGSLDACGGTPTADAMEIAYSKMARHSYPASLMLVITDGDPDRPSAVVEADAKLRKKGVIPVGIGIAGCTAVKKIFKEHVVFDDISQLAPQLGKITKKRLVKMLERHDSL